MSSVTYRMEGIIMRIWRSMRARPGRFLVVLLTLLVFVALLAIDTQHSFARTPGYQLVSMLSFGFSILVALSYLAIGVLVWLFARERWVAFLLFSLSFTTMMAFTLQTGAQLNDPVLSAISDSGAALSLTLLATLLLFFPANHYAILRERAALAGSIPPTRLSFNLLRGYLLLIWGLCAVSVVQSVFQYLTQSPLLSLLTAISYIFDLIVLMGIVAAIILAYRRKSSLRERQQLRFFVIGVIAAIAPLLILTVLPGLLTSLGIPAASYTVDGQISSATVILLPAAFGYSILRYQILVFDRYIQRFVSWTTGIVFLALLGYGIGVVCGLLFSSPVVVYTGVLISSLVLLAPLSWWLAHVTAERLFFSEMRHYRRLIDKPDTLARETMDLAETAELLTLAVVKTFDTSEVCLFVLDGDSGHFQLTPPLHENEGAREHLARRLQAAYQSQRTSKHHQTVPTFQDAGRIKAGLPLLQNVDIAKRPLFLSEAVKAPEDQPAGLARFLSTSSDVDDPLLVPMRVQGEMIGLLALGRRGDYGQYAGPDFEIIDLLLSRYSSLLENARLYEQASRHGAMLNALYSAGASLERSYQSIDEVATAYAGVASETAKSGADVWLIDEDHRALVHACHVGEGASLAIAAALQDGDWRAWFYEGDSSDGWRVSSAGVPPCFEQIPDFPVAWLPLEKGEQRFGVLALTYTRPHIFSEEEKRLWGMLASQCAAAMESAQASIALRLAYERQKELDQLKDEFIITASHELRTPLTAVQGYIELLQGYDDQLAPEIRAEFIAKAGRGCDELTLMVNNIMDASRVQEGVEEIQLGQVPLATSVAQVLEIMEAAVRRENRQVSVDIAPDLTIVAEEQRLKQIILNVVGNALKYSEPGTPLEITARPVGDSATLCELRIRDYGSGVPLEDQQRLFDRFVRLERDMNSPVRGAGLGLFICRQLVEAMGGDIRVESSGNAGEGSTFIISLRLYRPALVPAQ